VELSLSPHFRREYASVYAAIRDFNLEGRVYRQLLGMIAPKPEKRPFWLLSVDVTPHSRPYAQTLEDRSYVHAPSAVKGVKPVTIGHAYSTVVLLPEKERGMPAWVVPALVRRVKSWEDAELVGAEQLGELLDDPTLPWHNQLCVQVGDSRYAKPSFLWRTTEHTNLVSIVRVRNNRVFYHPYQPRPGQKGGPGRPRIYGQRFALNRPETWSPPNEEQQWQETTARGHVHTITIRVWHSLIMRGKRNMPMHRHPFTLVQVVVHNAQGQLVYRRPLWFIIFGLRRGEVHPRMATQAYRQRFDHEHFLRFGKRNLLSCAYQTVAEQREEKWWQLAFLAYQQLWLARDQAQLRWRPWERYLPARRHPHLSPSMVQRDFHRIIAEFGTPARPPKRRGKSPGRTKGMRLSPRPRHPVVKKRKKKRKKAA